MDFIFHNITCIAVSRKTENHLMTENRRKTLKNVVKKKKKKKKQKHTRNGFEKGKSLARIKGYTVARGIG